MVTAVMVQVSLVGSRVFFVAALGLKGCVAR